MMMIANKNNSSSTVTPFALTLFYSLACQLYYKYKDLNKFAEIFKDNCIEITTNGCAIKLVIEQKRITTTGNTQLHIDIAICYNQNPILYIEVDGNQHYCNAENMRSDMWRSFYAARDGIPTIRIPNGFVNNRNTIKAICTIIEERIKFIDDKQHRGLVLHPKRLNK